MIKRRGRSAITGKLPTKSKLSHIELAEICLSKIRYFSRKYIKEVQAHLRKRGTKVGIYRCRVCGGYHFKSERRRL
jgi:hypothetical protein